MSIRSPRRIFRRAAPPGGSRLVRVLLWLAVPGGLAVAGAAMLAAPDGLPAASRPGLSGLTMTADATQVAMVDGDTLRLRDTVIRLRGVAAPARGTGCGAVAGHTPVAGRTVDCGGRASVILAGLVSHGRTECRLDGRDAGGRPLGLCRSGGVEINRAVVESGWALAEPDQPALDAAEHAARAQRRGLWAAGAAQPQAGAGAP